MIKHFSSGNLSELSSHDITALMLLFYFKRDLDVEQLCEFLDIDMLLSALMNRIRTGSMSRDEICACCLGIKRVSGMSVNNLPLRKALYGQLQVSYNHPRCLQVWCRRSGHPTLPLNWMISSW